MSWGGCCGSSSSSGLEYFSPRTSDILLTTNTGILSIVITIPEGSWGIVVLATGTISNSAGGNGNYQVNITDSVLGTIGGHGGNQAASLVQDFAIQASVDNLGPGSRTISLLGSDVGGAGAPTLNDAELRVRLVPAANLTVAAPI